MIRKIIIVDEFLENKIGHYYEYNKSVLEAFQKQKIECKIYCKSTVTKEIQDEIGAIPFFEYDVNAKIRKNKIVGFAMYRYYYWKSIKIQIKKIIEIEKGNNVIFFFPNVFWYNIIPIAKAIKNTNQFIALLYRLSIIEPIEKNNFAKIIVKKIYKRYSALLAKNKNIFFYSDSEVVTEDFQNVIVKPMLVLPIPHLADIDGVGKYKSDNYFRLYLPGVARKEKGIEIITDAMEILQNKYAEVINKIELVTQFFGDKEKDFFGVLKSRLQKLNCKNIFLESLSSEEYQQQIKSADVILIPYLNSCGYRARTSGVLAEAIAACKPFISTENSWMHKQGINYKVGISIKDESAEELCEAIIKLYENYSYYVDNSIKAKESWSQFHSKENFAKILLSNFQIP